MLMSDLYAPYPLADDPSAFGLDTTTVSNELGSCVARHTAVRSSTRATIFLHGAAGSWTTWTPMLAAGLASGVRFGDIVLLDLPGWGDATLTDDPQNRTIESICTLVKELAEELGYTEWDLVGHSLGGFIALHMAALWPEAVLSVGTVSGTTWAVMHSVAHPVRNFGELPGFTLLWQVMRLLAVLGPVGTGLVRGMSAIGLLRPVTFPLFRHWTRVPTSQGKALGVEIRPLAFDAATAVTRGYDADARWSTISCPVRATKGDRDIFVADADLDHLGRILPASIRTVIADCGHFGTVERPAAVLAALGFVGRNPG